MKHRKPLVSFSTKMVIASTTAVIVYTFGLFWLALLNIANGTDVWPPAELTGCWYGFWALELVHLASIKKCKIKNKFEQEDEDAE